MIPKEGNPLLLTTILKTVKAMCQLPNETDKGAEWSPPQKTGLFFASTWHS